MRTAIAALLLTVGLCLVISLGVIAFMGPSWWAMPVIALLCTPTGYVVSRILSVRYYSATLKDHR